MSVPTNPEATELGTAVKIFGDRRAALSTRDLSDPDQVFELALAIVRADDRRLMQVSVAETRALAKLAALSSVIASQFLRVIALSDANAPKDELLKALQTAAETSRSAIEAAT
jgi:hypothetical protein